MAKNAAQQLIDYGQSVWYDNISRDILQSGELQHLINDCGVRGLTSNPAIFDKALGSGTAYDEQVVSLQSRDMNVDEVFEELAVQDIASKTDL